MKKGKKKDKKKDKQEVYKPSSSQSSVSLSQPEQESDIESYKRKSREKPASKPSTQRPSKSGKPSCNPAPESASSLEAIQIRNEDGNTFKHTPPAFIHRWDRHSNELVITDDEYRDLPPGLSTYWKVKCKNMNAIIFVQMGRIEFHAYEVDAIRLNELFGKNIGKFSKCLMVHFWEKELELIKGELHERKIPMQIFGEIEDEQYRAKHKLIRREITEVINPAVNITYASEQISDSERYLLSLYKEGTRYGVAVVNCQANRYFIEDVESISDLKRVINKFKPVEVVHLKDNIDEELKIIMQICKPYVCELNYPKQTCKEVLEGFLQLNDCMVFEMMRKQLHTLRKGESFKFQGVVYAIEVTLQYFKKLGLEKNIFSNSVFNLVSLEALCTKAVLDAQVYQNLQVFEIKEKEDSFGHKGTLLSYLDKCITKCGKRKLRKWLDSPLTNQKAIRERQVAITDIINNFSIFKNLFQQLQKFPDFQKSIANVYHWVVDRSWKANFKKEKDYDQGKNPVIVKIRNIRDLLVEIVKFQDFIQEFQPYHAKMKSKYLKDLTTIFNDQADSKKVKYRTFQGIQVEESRYAPDVKKYCQDIIKTIVFNERTNTIEPVEGIYEEFDNRKAQVNELYKKLDEELEMWKEKLNCKKLKYVSARSRNEIEMPKQIVKQKIKGLNFSSSTQKFSRFTTFNTEVLTAALQQEQEQMDKAIAPFLDSIIQHFACFKRYWTEVADIFSELDVLYSLAKVSNEMQISCIPEFTKDEFEYEDAIHVGLMQMADHVVRNSLKFSGPENVLLITGPNMGGKSTILRQTCLLAIIAQVGCYVPARRYKAILFDHIFCRIGASDRIIEKKSTFYVQLQQTKRILDEATSNSLVVIDQLGRGTSTFDGVSIAYGTLSHIINKINCFTLFSTHYSILADEFTLCKKVRNKTLEYHLDGIHLKFTYKLIDGVAEKSFAENVARMVGIDERILDTARDKSRLITKEMKALGDLQKKTKEINDIFREFRIEQW